MNYEDLKNILRDLKKMFRCTKCHRRFMDRNISVLATIPTDGIFQLDCESCSHSMLVNISLRSESTIQETTIRENNPIRTSRIITTNDFLDMHIFLDSFNGDFKKLFK